MIVIGILCEGYKDEKPLKRIITNLVTESGLDNDVSFVNFISEGPIEPKIPVAITKFFVTSKADFAIFVSDTDRNLQKRIGLQKLVNKYNLQNNNILITCPDPHLESWFIQEESAIKSVFNLKGNLSIPYPELEPKSRIEKLFRESQVFDYTYTIYDVYEKIADKLNLLTLSKKNICPSFHVFYKSFNELIKLIKSQNKQ